MRDRRLTYQQLRALAMIEEYTVQYDACPTLQELAKRLALASRSAAMYRTDELERQGLVVRERNKVRHSPHRTLRVTDSGRRLVARWQAFCAAGQMYGERELLLGADEWTAVGKLAVPVRGFHVQRKGEAVVLTFRSGAERDAWVATYLGALDGDADETGGGETQD
jgi:DNA-binding MarR family transcriptional regulator